VGINEIISRSCRCSTKHVEN